MEQVLTSTQTTGRNFRTTGAGYYLIVADHAGGTWVLQIRTPTDEWIDTDVSFIAEGVKFFESSAHVDYRVTGGSVGAQAWVTPNKI